MRSAEAIILAGGYGSRMGEYTREQQKCLLPIDEKPTLYHILDNLVESFGSVDVKIGVAYQAHKVKEYVDKYVNERSISVTYVPHEPGSESFLAYKSMEPYIQSDIFTITPGDIIALPSAFIAVNQIFEKSDSPLALTVSSKLDEVDSHGVGIVEEGLITEYLYPPPENIPDGANRDMNIYAANKNFFELLDRYGKAGKPFSVSMSEIIEDLPVPAHVYEEQWIHIGYPSDLKKSMLGNK